MALTKWIAESLFFVIGIPIMAFQSMEMLHAVIQFIADIASQYQHHP